MTVAREEWSFLGASVLMVSPYPPTEDGIGRYAEQVALALRPDRELRVLGLPWGGGDLVRDLQGGLRPLRILRHARRRDEILIQYHPDYFMRRGRPLDRLAVPAALALLARLRRTTVVVHEPDPELPAGAGPRTRALFAVAEPLRRAMWRGTANLVFHTDFERSRHAQRFGRGRAVHRLVSPGGAFRPAAQSSRPEARERLGLTRDRVIVLMIGFISAVEPDKGYDRAVEAVRALNCDRLELHIVGSPIRRGGDVERLLEWLREQAAASPSVCLHEGFVDDESFDLWMLASDAVLTPYRTSSSSGVLERAHLLGRRVVTSDAGGLGEQAGPDDLVFATDSELAEALRRVVEEAEPG